MILNARTVVPSHDVIRGGILEPDSVLVEDRDGDSFGGFTYRNYFGARSTWTRHTLLTKEGFLIVRDIYVSCSETAGYRVGPIWYLRADGTWTESADGDSRRKFPNMPPRHDGQRHWFEAPAFDHASWQTRKNVFCFIFILLLTRPMDNANMNLRRIFPVKSIRTVHGQLQSSRPDNPKSS